jgi:hypothetical protein
MVYMDSGRLLPLTSVGAGIDFIHIFRTVSSRTSGTWDWSGLAEKKNLSKVLSEKSPHTDRDFIARAANVGQAHRDGLSWCHAVRHPDVHLIQIRESRRLAKE